MANPLAAMAAITTLILMIGMIVKRNSLPWWGAVPLLFVLFLHFANLALGSPTLSQLTGAAE